MDVAYNFTQKQKLDFIEICAETGFIWPVMEINLQYNKLYKIFKACVYRHFSCKRSIAFIRFSKGAIIQTRLRMASF